MESRRRHVAAQEARGNKPQALWFKLRGVLSGNSWGYFLCDWSPVQEVLAYSIEADRELLGAEEFEG